MLTDGRIHVGLHREDVGTPQITFVRHELLRQLDALERLGVEFETRRLGNDVFNEISWRDPSGHLVRLVEARTFSPAKIAAAAESICGQFREIGLPSADAATSKDWWESLGFVGLDEPDARLPHVCCTSDTLNVGLYRPQDLRAPTLVFEADDVPACVAKLISLGVQATHATPGALPARNAALLTAPEGTPILIYSSGA